MSEYDGDTDIHDGNEMEAIEHTVLDPKAIYGYWPDRKSERLGAFADYDWTDPVLVRRLRNERREYHLLMASMLDMLKNLDGYRNRIKIMIDFD